MVICIYWKCLLWDRDFKYLTVRKNRFQCCGSLVLSVLYVTDSVALLTQKGRVVFK